MTTQQHPTPAPRAQIATTDYVNEHLRAHRNFVRSGGYSYKSLTPRMTLADGTVLSVQASHGHYCDPRIDEAETYSEVEVGYPSRAIPEIIEYAEENSNPTQTVYGWVPVDVLNAVIAAAGGVK